MNYVVKPSNLMAFVALEIRTYLINFTSIIKTREKLTLTSRPYLSHKTGFNKNPNALQM